MSRWDLPSAIVGILLGTIISLAIVAIFWYTRSLMFSVCPVSQPACRSQDYLQDPGDALANGSNINDILFLNGDQEKPTLVYKRVPSTNTCTPSPSNQTVVVQYPQWCQFRTTGDQLYEGRNLIFGSPTYSYKDQTNTEVHVFVNPGGQCDVRSSTGNVVVSGKSLLKWDPNAVVTDLQ